MKERLSKTQFKARALEYFRKVQSTKRPLVITERGRPVLEISPFVEDPDESLQSLRGSLVRFDEPTEAVGLEDWELLP